MAKNYYEEYNAKASDKYYNDIMKNYTYDHCAWAKGYQSRKCPVQISEYKGKFGKGYTVHKSTTASNQYHIVEYWIKKEEH